jgi:60 kDa SS-A/Ro ribonucleoprotein
MMDFADGYTWLIDDWMRLDCVLLPGSEGAALYTGERALTIENARAVTACLAEDGVRVVQRALEIRNDPALLVLAMAAAHGDAATRAAALKALGHSEFAITAR